MELRFEGSEELGYDPLGTPPKGEICLRGPIIFQGYYQDKKKTDEAFGECALAVCAYLYMVLPRREPRLLCALLTTASAVHAVNLWSFLAGCQQPATQRLFTCSVIARDMYKPRMKEYSAFRVECQCSCSMKATGMHEKWDVSAQTRTDSSTRGTWAS